MATSSLLPFCMSVAWPPAPPRGLEQGTRFLSQELPRYIYMVREGPFHLNCKNPKIYMGCKTSPEQGRPLCPNEITVLLSLVNAVCESHTVFFAPVDECIFISNVLGCKIRIPSYLLC